LNSEIILKYFKDLDSNQVQKIVNLYSVYELWNNQINVISRKDFSQLYLHHVLHSLAIAKFIQFENNTKVLDVGCGGGFPGVPLSILFPTVQFTLLDSIAKKIKVVNEVVTELGIKNISTQNTRVESIKTQYQFIVSRAVTYLPEFVTWTHNKISKENNNSLKNGILYLKGGNLDVEINETLALEKQLRKNIYIRKISLKDYFEEEFFDTKYLLYLRFE
jgi:16S rRNA (guanine527-N7)-methyltransferase